MDGCIMYFYFVYDQYWSSPLEKKIKKRYCTCTYIIYVCDPLEEARSARCRVAEAFLYFYTWYLSCVRARDICKVVFFFFSTPRRAQELARSFAKNQQDAIGLKVGKYYQLVYTIMLCIKIIKYTHYDVPIRVGVHCNIGSNIIMLRNVCVGSWHHGCSTRVQIHFGIYGYRLRGGRAFFL